MLTEQNNFLCVAVGSISTQKNKSMELFMTASSAAEDHHNSLKAELHQQFSDQTRLILQLTNKVIVSFTYFYAAAVPQLPFLWYSAFHRINCKAWPTVAWKRDMKFNFCRSLEILAYIFWKMNESYESLHCSSDMGIFSRSKKWLLMFNDPSYCVNGLLNYASAFNTIDRNDIYDISLQHRS